jgi:SAM-dependent methyltransferase
MDDFVYRHLDPQTQSQSQLHTSGEETLLLQDKSNGYEQVARRFMSTRNPRTGATIIREWSRTVPPRSAILDLGCGHGVPISQTLIEEGFTVFGVDASRTLIEAFRKRFLECAGVEDSDFFQRTFDGVVACGLMFLMPEDTHSLVIHKVARALNPNGRFEPHQLPVFLCAGCLIWVRQRARTSILRVEGQHGEQRKETPKTRRPKRKRKRQPLVNPSSEIVVSFSAGKDGFALLDVCA